MLLNYYANCQIFVDLPVKLNLLILFIIPFLNAGLTLETRGGRVYSLIFKIYIFKSNS